MSVAFPTLQLYYENGKPLKLAHTGGCCQTWQLRTHVAGELHARKILESERAQKAICKGRLLKFADWSIYVIANHDQGLCMQKISYQRQLLAVARCWQPSFYLVQVTCGLLGKPERVPHKPVVHTVRCTNIACMSEISTTMHALVVATGQSGAAAPSQIGRVW